MEEGGVGGSEVMRKGVRRGVMPHLSGGMELGRSMWPDSLPRDWLDWVVRKGKGLLASVCRFGWQ